MAEVITLVGNFKCCSISKFYDTDTNTHVAGHKLIFHVVKIILQHQNWKYNDFLLIECTGIPTYIVRICVFTLCENKNI